MQKDYGIGNYGRGDMGKGIWERGYGRGVGRGIWERGEGRWERVDLSEDSKSDNY